MMRFAKEHRYGIVWYGVYLLVRVYEVGVLQEDEIQMSKNKKKDNECI